MTRAPRSAPRSRAGGGSRPAPPRSRPRFVHRVLFHSGSGGLGHPMPIASATTPTAAPALRRPTLERRRLRLADGALTTVHVARFARAEFGLRVAALQPCSTVRAWCRRNGAEHAIVGGFYMRPGGPALGDLWIDSRALPTED